MTEVDIAKLRAKAEVASSGAEGEPWFDEHDLGFIAFEEVDAKYIAAANPATVLALLDRLETAEADIEKREADLKHWEEVGAPAWIEQRDELIAEQRERAERAEAAIELWQQLVRDLLDDDECWFDHHGGCQAHGYLSLKPGEMCPHMEGKQLLAALDTEEK